MHAVLNRFNRFMMIHFFMHIINQFNLLSLFNFNKTCGIVKLNKIKTRQQLKNTLLLNAYRLRSFAFKKKY